MPEDTDALSALVDEVRRFAQERIDPIAIDRDHHIPTDLLEDLANLGIFGLSIPEEHGGLGLSLGPICDVIIALASRDPSVATTVGLHLGLGTRGLIAFATPEQQAHILPDLASGAHLAAFAATEAGAGSDLRSVATIGIEHKGGLLLNGEKIFVTNGGLAQIFTLLVSTPGLGGRRKGFSLIWLDRDTPGVSVGPEENKLGLRGSSTTSLLLDDVQLSLDHIIGEPGHGMEAAMHVLAWGRTAMAAGCVGAAGIALQHSLRHVHQRVQFGKPLSAQPVVREQLADLHALHFAMDAMVRYTAASTEASVLERRSLATKVLCSEGNWEICDRALQLFGGSGYIEETGIPRMLRDARITRIFEGANDVLLGLLGTLEATRPSSPFNATGPLAERAMSFCETVDTRRDHLAALYKMRLLRRPRLLAQLGKLAVLRQSVVTVVESVAHSHTPITHDLAEHWIHLCFRRAAPHLTDPSGDPRIDRIVEHRSLELRS